MTDPFYAKTTLLTYASLAYGSLLYQSVHTLMTNLSWWPATGRTQEAVLNSLWGAVPAQEKGSWGPAIWSTHRPDCALFGDYFWNGRAFVAPGQETRDEAVVLDELREHV